MRRVSLASSSYTTVSIVAIVVNILLMASKMAAGILFGSAGIQLVGAYMSCPTDKARITKDIS